MKHIKKMTLAVLMTGAVAWGAQPAQRPGDVFVEIVMLHLEQDDLFEQIAAGAKRVGPDEAALIWLLGDLIGQCFTIEEFEIDGCAFVPKHPVGRWGALVTQLEDALLRGQIEPLGGLFKCAVDHLRGELRVGAYLDCLKVRRE